MRVKKVGLWCAISRGVNVICFISVWFAYFNNHLSFDF